MKIVRGIYPHKWTAVFDDGKRVSFGAVGYEDYTQSHSVERRRLYRLRHAKDLRGDPRTPGYLAYYILWGDNPSMERNITDYRRRFLRGEP